MQRPQYRHTQLRTMTNKSTTMKSCSEKSSAHVRRMYCGSSRTPKRKKVAADTTIVPIACTLHIVQDTTSQQQYRKSSGYGSVNTRTTRTSGCETCSGRWKA